MRRLCAQVRSFEPGLQLLMVNQFGINLGFYMLMPYLADHLAHGLGLAAWAVGLVLGVRNLSQQGMFWLGGTLADRIGYKPMILAGCALRTGAFVLLALAGTVPALVVASAATGFAGALFNPAVRAYVARGAGERRVEAFAVFNVFYQAGILLGPLAGLALLALDFRVVCAASAAVFGVLAIVQARALPARRPAPDPERTSGWRGIATDWRTILRNRPFVLFSVAMAGSYLLAFQTYLALPLQARTLLDEDNGAAMGVVFAVSALVAVAGQLRLTDWARDRLDPPKAIALGLAVMGAAFLPLLPGPHRRVHGLSAVLGLGGWWRARRCWPWGPRCCTRSRWTPWCASRESVWWAPTTGPTARWPASPSRPGTSPWAACSTWPTAPGSPGCPGPRCPCSASPVPPP